MRIQMLRMLLGSSRVLAACLSQVVSGMYSFHSACAGGVLPRLVKLLLDRPNIALQAYELQKKCSVHAWPHAAEAGDQHAVCTFKAGGLGASSSGLEGKSQRLSLLEHSMLGHSVLVSGASS